jgi:hypothetical protein
MSFPPNPINMLHAMIRMNSMQEAEFHLSCYHYFSWRAHQERSKEDASSPSGEPAASSNKNPGGFQPNDANRGESCDQESSDSFMQVAAHEQKPSAEKFEAVADVLAKNFPQHLAHITKQNPMLRMAPPIISTLYSDYPKLQRQIFTLRSQIAELQATTEQYQNELNRKGDDVMPATKRKRLDRDAAAEMNISDRPDVPEDVKQLVGRSNRRFDIKHTELTL